MWAVLCWQEVNITGLIKLKMLPETLCSFASLTEIVPNKDQLLRLQA